MLHETQGTAASEEKQNATPEITDAEVKAAVQQSIRQTRLICAQMGGQFPSCVSEHNFYHPIERKDWNWTEGFFTGELWLAYEHTGDETFKKSALAQVDILLNRIKNKQNVEHHDMGFLYSPSCAAAYLLTGDERAREAVILAADQLISRFQPKGGFIQAWGSMSDPGAYRLIVDCLLNLPLLYFASRLTGDEKYAEIARRHTDTTMSVILRPDHSVYHTYYFDRETGRPLKGVTAQGNRDGSAWARGQAWAVYGIALCYANTRQYLEEFRQVTEFFISHLPADLVPYWDFDFGDGSGEPKDSSAAAIAACGMLEISKWLKGEEGRYYATFARKIVKSLTDHYAVKDEKISNGLLLHGVYSKISKLNHRTEEEGVDECNAWGDYFYAEALMRLSKDWKLYW